MDQPKILVNWKQKTVRCAVCGEKKWADKPISDSQFANVVEIFKTKHLDCHA